MGTQRQNWLLSLTGFMKLNLTHGKVRTVCPSPSS